MDLSKYTVTNEYRTLKGESFRITSINTIDLKVLRDVYNSKIDDHDVVIGYMFNSEDWTTVILSEHKDFDCYQYAKHFSNSRNVTGNQNLASSDNSEIGTVATEMAKSIRSPWKEWIGEK